MALLWCSTCREFKSKICSMKNYSQAWVTGSENLRTSNMLDHMVSDQHKAAMSHLRTAQARANDEPITSYAPVGPCLIISRSGMTHCLITFQKLYLSPQRRSSRSLAGPPLSQEGKSLVQCQFKCCVCTVQCVPIRLQCILLVT